MNAHSGRKAPLPQNLARGREHQEDAPRANMSTLLNAENPVQNNSCRRKCRSYKRSLLTSKSKDKAKVNRLLSRMLMCRLVYLRTKPTLGLVPVELLRDGAEAEVEVEVEAEEVGRRKASPIATTVRPQVIGLEIAGAKQKQTQSLVRQNQKLSARHLGCVSSATRQDISHRTVLSGKSSQYAVQFCFAQARDQKRTSMPSSMAAHCAACWTQVVTAA